MRNDWHGLIKVLDINHVRNGQIIWEAKNLHNILHQNGEEYFLTVLFNNDGSLPPANYHLGLDERSILLVDDTMSNLIDEPTVNGYARQPVSSVSGWTIELANGVFRALGPIITFGATGGSWGPVSNLFLTNRTDNDGFLIASVALSNTITMSDGDAINMRMGLSLRDFTG